ncbi:hypothetical protein TNCV_2298531 [Trichonephila clavipes]|nr:hypothetical protein TNCV_2298531 [Trichonephila clavipes]
MTTSIWIGVHEIFCAAPLFTRRLPTGSMFTKYSVHTAVYQTTSNRIDVHEIFCAVPLLSLPDDFQQDRCSLNLLCSVVVKSTRRLPTGSVFTKSSVQHRCLPDDFQQDRCSRNLLCSAAVKSTRRLPTGSVLTKSSVQRRC